MNESPKKEFLKLFSIEICNNFAVNKIWYYLKFGKSFNEGKKKKCKILHKSRTEYLNEKF